MIEFAPVVLAECSSAYAKRKSDVDLRNSVG